MKLLRGSGSACRRETGTIHMHKEMLQGSQDFASHRGAEIPRVTQEDSVYLHQFCEIVAFCQYLLTWVLLLVFFLFITLISMLNFTLLLRRRIFLFKWGAEASGHSSRDSVCRRGMLPSRCPNVV